MEINVSKSEEVLHFNCAHELLVARELDRLDVGEECTVLEIDVFDKILEGEVVNP